MFEWFDDAQQLTVLIIEGQVFMLDYTEAKPAMKLLYNFEDLSSQILLSKVSLDREVIAFQISDNTVQILDIANRRKWTIQPRSGDDAVILSNGILWSDHGGSSQDLVLVTSKGLEIYKVSAKKGQCKLSRSISLPISFFWYNADSRMILTASPNKPVKRFLGSSTPVTKDTLLVDGFFLNVEKPNIPSLELPPPDRIPRLELGHGVDHNRINLVHVYGLLLALVQYSSEEGDFVTIYHVTKSPMEKIATLALGYTPQQLLKVSTYDNLVLFHDISRKVTLAFDIMKPPRKTSASTTGYIDPVINPTIATFCYVPLEEVQTSSPSRIRAKQFHVDYGIPSVRDVHSLKFIQAGKVYQETTTLPVPAIKGFVCVENVLEAYPFYSPIVFEIYSSGWAYDCERRIMWRIECNPFQFAKQIEDPWERMGFLSRRGKVVHWIADDPLPIVASSPYESMVGVACLFQMVLQTLDRQASDRELISVFRCLHIPYWNEAQKLRVMLNTSARTIDHRVHGDQDLNEALLVPNYRRQELVNSVMSQSSTTTSNNKLTKSPSSDTLSTQKISLRAMRRPLRESLSRLKGSENPIELEADILEPLEPVGTSQLFLPDISVIGIKVRNLALKNIEAMKEQHSQESTNHVLEGFESLGVRSPSPPMITMALEHKPIAIRRDEKGDLLVSQHDMLAYIWLPLLASDGPVAYAYLADCLSAYITALAEMELDVIPAVNILHATLLFYLGRVHEVTNLLKNCFYNDSSELALMLLQFAGMLEDEIKSQQYVLKHTDALLTLKEDTYRYQLPTWRDLLQRQGMDMLWRCGEKITVVKWLLTQCRLKEAFALCLPKNDRWDDTLRPSSIPGSEFFISAVNLLKVQSPHTSEAQERARLEANTQLFFNLHNFLAIWDPQCLLPHDKSVSSSPIDHCFPCLSILTVCVCLLLCVLFSIHLECYR